MLEHRGHPDLMAMAEDLVAGATLALKVRLAVKSGSWLLHVGIGKRLCEGRRQHCAFNFPVKLVLCRS
jgi:hypothetical protein